MAARDATLYVPSGSSIRAISADDGNDVWTYTLSQPGYVVSMPTLASDGTIYVPTYGGGLNAARLIAVSPSGTELWSYTTNSDSSGLASVGQDGVVYFGDGLGILRALDPDGSLRWSLQPSTRTYSQLVLGANDTHPSRRLRGLPQPAARFVLSCVIMVSEHLLPPTIDGAGCPDERA